uniref:WGS project CAEQ00000000 data, annotated contig 1909 n=1 Tax=Trypanosoma congolense (strain IL3000) TaxID=1068625 RepID=F9W9X4_TRYCI|nr:unnamed protein product [Trypanosoma congolense IL3000]
MHTPTAKFEHRVDGDGEDEPRPCKVVPAPQPWRFGGITTAQNEMFIRSPNLSAITLEAEPLASKRLNHVLSVTSFKEWSALYLQLRQCLCVDQIRRIDFSEVELDGAQWGWLCQKMLPAMPKLASLRLVRMNITDMRLAELLGWCQRHDGLRGMAPFPRGTKKIFPLFPPLNGAQSIMSDDLLLGDVDADHCGQAGVSPVPCNEESSRTVFRELCVLDLSENYLTHRSATVIGKFMLWTADTLDELRLMGNPLQDYGLQVIGIYIARLQLSSLRKEAHLFPQSLVKLYSKIDERKSTVNNGVCQQKQEKPPGPSLTSCTISKRNFDTDRQAQDDTLHIHLGISLLDVRSCQASVRGISELAAAASLAHRMNTLLLAGNGLPSSPRPGRQPFRARECNNNIVESPLSSSTSDGSHGGYSVPSAKVDSLSSVCKLSRFAELRHPCALSTIDASGVALSEVCSPAGCRDFFLNLFFCCPKLKVFDISGSFDERQLSEPTKRQIFEDSRKVFSIQRQQEGGTHHHSLRDMANESDFALDRVSYDKQACVGNIFCELFAHAALNAVKRKCFAPAAFCRLKELRLEGTGMTDAAAKSLAIAVLSTTSTGVLADLVSLQVANNFLTSCGCACLLLTFVTEWPMTTSSLKYIALQGNLGTSCHDESSLNEVRQAVLFAVGRRIRDQRHGAQVPPLLVQFGAVGAEASSCRAAMRLLFESAA